MFDFFQYDFMVRAILGGLMISILAPMLGVFMVARKESLLSDTFAHVALTGVGLGLLFGFNPILGAIGVALVSGLGIEFTLNKSRLSRDAIQSLFLSGGLALAILLAHLNTSARTNFDTYLFGSLLTVQALELWLLLGTLILMSLFTYLFYWQWVTLSLSESLAQASSLNARRLNRMLLMLSALVVALSLKIVGGLLIGALIVIPVLTATQYSKSFKQTLTLSILISVIAMFVGLMFSYYVDVPTGSTIVLVNILFFLIGLLFKKRV